MDVVRLLLDEGADPNRLDPYGRTPAMTVIRVCRAPAHQSLETMRAEFDQRIVQPLHLLASYGADLNKRASDGRRVEEFLDEERDPDFTYSSTALRKLLESDL